MLTRSGDWLVEQHETNLTAEFCGEGFLKILERGGRWE
jgi:hypothetical protein